MGLFLGDSRQRPVAGAEQRFGRQGENLLAHLLAGQVPGLVAAANGAGEYGVAHDRHVRGVFRPGANDVGGAVFGMARSVAVGDAQAAEVNELIRAIALIDRARLAPRNAGAPWGTADEGRPAPRHGPRGRE